MLILSLLGRGHASGLWQVPMFMGLLGVTAEDMTLAAKRPEWLASRLLLGGGRALQRWVTTAEPSAAEQAVGCHSLLACLAEHARIVALDDAAAPAIEPAAAVAVAAA